MAQIIDLQTIRSLRSAVQANKCCTRCGAGVWHMRENGEVYCADCEQKYPFMLQVNNEYLGEK